MDLPEVVPDLDGSTLHIGELLVNIGLVMSEPVEKLLNGRTHCEILAMTTYTCVTELYKLFV